MKMIVGFFIFCLVLFIYLHIQFHLKTSNNYNVYEIDNSWNKNKMEEVFDIKQPVVLDYYNENTNQCNFDFFKKYYNDYNIQIKQNILK